MASVVDICNRALTRIGEARITALTDNTKAGRACNNAWEHIRDEVLRAHPWNSVSARAQLAELAATPDFGHDHQYQFPANCLRVLEVDTTYTWVVEGTKILTDEGSPIDVRYIKRETNTGVYDPLLVSAIVARLAVELAEELTQSSTKKAAAAKEYDRIMAMARSVDAQESSPMPLAEDDWITARE